MNWNLSYWKERWNQGYSKKKVELTVAIMMIGIILMIAGGYFSKNTFDSNYEKNKNVKKNLEDTYHLESNLKEILSNINGVGKVDILISYATTRERIPVFETSTNENESQESHGQQETNRGTKQKDIDSKVAFEENKEGEKIPIIQKEIEPEIRGVLVLAEGARNEIVQEQLRQAVMVLTDLSANRIQILPRRKE